MERGVEFLDEFLQLFTVDIADSEELETLRSPASNVVSLHCLQLRRVTFGGGSLRNEEIDHVLAASIDNRGDGLAVDIVEPFAVRSTTGGAISSLPLNHGFTICWSLVCTSVRWLA